MISNHIKHSFIIICLIVLIVIFWILSYGWFGNKYKLVENTEYLMSTSVTVKIYVNNKNKGNDIIKKVFAEAKRIEHIMEPLKGDGELRRINTGPAERWWNLSPELKAVINHSVFFYRKTGGAFDPTIAFVKWLWDFENGGRLPSENEIKEALGTVGLSRVKIKGDSLSLERPGTKLDFGGVAKGYIIDKMIMLLKESCVVAGLVNAGGDIYTFGKKPGGIDWIIGFRHPRTKETIKFDTISLPAVATSGDYERFFIQDGVRYHHILDPKTGYPARGCASVTVWAKTATDADIVSTAVFVLGPEKGLELVENMDDYEVLIFFEKDGGVKNVMSSGVKDKIKL